MISILLLATIFFSITPFFAGKSFRSVSLTALAGSSVLLVLSAAVALPVLTGAPITEGHGFWYLDAFGAMLLFLIGFVQWTSTMASIPYLGAELHERMVDFAHVRRYYSFASLFVLSMFLMVVSDNLGVMWIALEATTLATTLLVAFYAREGSLEAAWKYLVVCSTGIALGLLGLLMTYYAATTAGALGGLNAMSWRELLQLAPHMSPSLLAVAFAFIFVGFGAKAGIAPMHTWLPDAHSRAPSPISGMLSSVLLSSALFGILRYKAIVDAAMGSAQWSNQLLLVFGVFTCALPAAFIVSQVDYKRLLAYSSVEHMGLMLVAIGLGAYGTVIAVVHMIAHILAKSALFFGAGSILVRYKSTKFKRVGEVMRVLPITGALFLGTMLMLIAVPPSPLFFTEYLLVALGIATHPWFTLVVLAALALIVAGFIRAFIPLFYRPPLVQDDRADLTQGGETWTATHTAVAIHLVVLVVFGVLLWSGMAYSFIGHIASSIS